MTIVRKGVQTGNQLKILLYQAARDLDISAFFKLYLNVNGKKTIVAEIISNEAMAEGTLFSEGLESVREKRELTITLPSDSKITILEMNDGENRRTISLE